MASGRTTPADGLQSFFSPRSVAVVGAQSQTRSTGNRLVRRLLEDAQGRVIYAVDRQPADVAGAITLRSLTELPEPVDLALVCGPAESVPGLLAQAAGRVGAIAIFSPGFAELGPAGRRLQDRLRQLVRELEVPVLGPNMGGIVDYTSNFMANVSPTFRETALAGDVSIVSQSGGFASAMAERLARSGLGLARVVMTGNEIGTTALDLIEFLAGDDCTSIVVTYLEQLRPQEHVLERLARAAERKPIIIEKVGRTQAGARAAASHTAALAGNPVVTEAALRQAGVITARSLDELADFTCGLASPAVRSRPRAKAFSRLGLISQGGGFLVELADLCREHGFDVPRLTNDTRDALSAFLPPTASTVNPVDLTGEVLNNPRWIPMAVEIAARDPGVDGLIVAISTLSSPEEIVRLGSVLRAAPTPVVVACVAQAAASAALAAELRRSSVFPLGSTRSSVVAMEGVQRYLSHAPQTRVRRREPDTAPGRGTADALSTALLAARRAHVRVLMEHESKVILKDAGLPVTRERLVHTRREAESVAREIGYPVTMKVMSRDIMHKTEAKVVKVGCPTPSAVRQAYGELQESARAIVPTPRVSGVLISETCEFLAEAIVGVRRDPTFGLVMACGPGGVLAELIGEVAVRVLPIGRKDALAMISETRLGALLNGWRGSPKGDASALAHLLCSLSDLCAPAAPYLESLDLNPVAVLAKEDGVKILDAGIWLAEDG
jgi:acyl-CoA synthetase (NDP forming)